MFYLLDLCFLTFVDSRHNNKGVLKELIKIVLLDSLKDIDDGVIFRGGMFSSNLDPSTGQDIFGCRELLKNTATVWFQQFYAFFFSQFIIFVFLKELLTSYFLVSVYGIVTSFPSWVCQKRDL